MAVTTTGMTISQAPGFDYDAYLQSTSTQDPMVFYMTQHLPTCGDPQDNSLYLRLAVYTPETQTSVVIIQRIFKNAQGGLWSPKFSLGSDGRVYDSPLLFREPHGTAYLEKVINGQIMTRELQEYQIEWGRAFPIRNSEMIRRIRLLQLSSEHGSPGR